MVCLRKYLVGKNLPIGASLGVFTPSRSPRISSFSKLVRGVCAISCALRTVYSDPTQTGSSSRKALRVHTYFRGATAVPFRKERRQQQQRQQQQQQQQRRQQQQHLVLSVFMQPLFLPTFPARISLKTPCLPPLLRHYLRKTSA